MASVRRRTGQDQSRHWKMWTSKQPWSTLFMAGLNSQYKEDVQLAARDFFIIRGKLSLHDGLLVRGDRIVVPFSLRKQILERIHEGHMGMAKCRERAAQSVWWPRIGRDIKSRVASCRHCLEKQPSQASEPLLPSALPDRPFQKVGIDICEFWNKHYLVQVDITQGILTSHTCPAWHQQRWSGN